MLTGRIQSCPLSAAEPRRTRRPMQMLFHYSRRLLPLPFCKSRLPFLRHGIPPSSPHKICRLPSPCFPPQRHIRSPAEMPENTEAPTGAAKSALSSALLFPAPLTGFPPSGVPPCRHRLTYPLPPHEALPDHRKALSLCNRKILSPLYALWHALKVPFANPWRKPSAQFDFHTDKWIQSHGRSLRPPSCCPLSPYLQLPVIFLTIPWLVLIQIVLQFAAAAGMPELAQRLRLNLADTLTGYAELLPYLFQCPRPAVIQSKTQP